MQDINNPQLDICHKKFTIGSMGVRIIVKSQAKPMKVKA